MQIQDRALDLPRSAPLLVAAVAAACTAGLSQRSTHTSTASASAPVHDSGPVMHDRPGDAAAGSAARGSTTAASHRWLRSDGDGGWYAIVQVFAGSDEPVNDIVETYSLSVVGSCQLTTITDRGRHHWWAGDLFIAHLRPVQRDPQTPHFVAPECLCNACFDDVAIHDLGVVALLPIDHYDITALDQMVTRGWPRTDLSAERRFPDREPGRHVVIASVTRDRHWRVIDPPAKERGFADLGPVPATAKLGARYAFVVSPGHPTRLVREIDDDSSVFAVAYQIEHLGSLARVVLAPAQHP